MKTILPALVVILALTACGGQNARTVPGQVKPGSPEYIMNEGLFYLNEGQIDLAEKKLLLALKKKPNMPKALNGLGLVYTYKRDFPLAISYFQRLLNLRPDSIDAYNSLGMIFSEQGKYDLAKEHFLRAATAEKYRTPENAYVNLASLELKHNKPESAERYIQKALEHNQRFAPIFNIKGVIAESKGDYAQAIRDYKKALSLLTEEDINILINLGRTYAKTGEKNKALDALERALILAPGETLKNRIREMIASLEN